MISSKVYTTIGSIRFKTAKSGIHLVVEVIYSGVLIRGPKVLWFQLGALTRLRVCVRACVCILGLTRIHPPFPALRSRTLDLSPFMSLNVTINQKWSINFEFTYSLNDTKYVWKSILMMIVFWCMGCQWDHYIHHGEK
jgi:hypothetical protein